jgi:hypothetical protein
VEGVDAYTQVERILSGSLRHVLVGANTGGFQSLGRQLFVLIRDQVGAEGEVIDRGTFTAKIEDTDLKYIQEITQQNNAERVGSGLTFGSGTPRLYLDLG